MGNRQWYHHQRKVLLPLPPALSSLPTQLAIESPESPLERQVRMLDKSLDPVSWRVLMEKRERQIYRIVIQGWNEVYGTGFLVQSDVVMTNYHVLQDVIDGSISPKKVFFISIIS